MERRELLRTLGSSIVGLAIGADDAEAQSPPGSPADARQGSGAKAGKPRSSEFVFARLRHTLVRFSARERERLRRYVEHGGLLFSDDCNHDVAGLYAVSFEREMATIFPGAAGRLPRLPRSHVLYRSVFPFPDGPPQTSHELNGWGDDMVHDYLRAVEHHDRIGVLYSNKDYGCEWDYDWRNKRFQRDDNTRFAVNIVSYAMTA